MKVLKKNKKGFTLVEVIVVLLIVGILLAITIPSIMGYVGKAKDAQYEAEGRSGFVAAQTIMASKSAKKGSALTQAELTAALTPKAIAQELGEYTTDANLDKVTIKSVTCTLDTVNTSKLKTCDIALNSTTKVVTFADGDTTVK